MIIGKGVRECFICKLFKKKKNIVSPPVVVVTPPVVQPPAGIYSAPNVTVGSTPMSYPPTIAAVSLNVDHAPGYTLKVIVSSNYAGTTVINSADIAIGTNTSTQLLAAVNAALASFNITSGTGYIFLRVDNGTNTGSYSVPVQYGTAAVPTITSPKSVTNYERSKLAFNVTFSAPVKNAWLTGQDRDQVELIGPRPGNSFTLRWTGDKTQIYYRNNSFYQNDIYDIGIFAEGLNGITGAVEPITVTLLDVDEDITPVTFTALTGLQRSTLTTSDIVDITGLSDGYEFEGGATTEYRRQRDGVWGDWTAPTVTQMFRNGDKAQMRATTGATYVSTSSYSFHVGAATANWSLTTLDDPASPVATLYASRPLKNGYDEGPNKSVPFNIPAGRSFLYIMVRNNANYGEDGNYGTQYTITVPGGTATLIYRQYQNMGGPNAEPNNSNETFWEINVPNAVSSFTFVTSNYRDTGFVAGWTVTGAGSATGGAGRPIWYNYPSPLVTNTPLNIDKIGIFVVHATDNTVSATGNNGEVIRGTFNDGAAFWGTKLTSNGVVGVNTLDSTGQPQGGYGGISAIALGA